MSESEEYNTDKNDAHISVILTIFKRSENVELVSSVEFEHCWLQRKEMVQLDDVFCLNRQLLNRELVPIWQYLNCQLLPIVPQVQPTAVFRGAN